MRITRKPGLVLCTGIVATALTAAPAVTQQASAILDEALAKYEARMRGITNYTVIQNAMGVTLTMKYERRVIDGHVAFLPASENRSDVRTAQDMSRYFGQLREHARYQGRETVDGHTTHVLRIEGSGGIDWANRFGEESGGAFVPDEFTMYIDAGDHVMRRVIVKGNVEINGSSKPVTNVIDYTDYREVDGMLHPYLTKVRMEGAMQAVEISPEQRAEAEANLAKLEKQMAEMPQSQRAMMEKMLGSQLEMLRKLVQSSALEVTIEVQELRVNEGT
jgi:hypothetical protein